MSTKLTKDDIVSTKDELIDYLGVKDNQADRSIMDMMFEFYTDFIDMDDPSEMVDAINNNKSIIQSILKKYKSKIDTTNVDTDDDYFTQLDDMWFKGSRKLNESIDVISEEYYTTEWANLVKEIYSLTEAFNKRYKTRVYITDETASWDWHHASINVIDGPDFIIKSFTNPTMGKDFFVLNKKISKICSKYSAQYFMCQHDDEKFPHGWSIQDMFNIAQINIYDE